ncbi:hypothetical protein NCS52_01566600 [Fusarium sp. LHS14.1]|nr:hypothetical protein NCS52_01566600 [Fusarium sp. LHS14.1]
MHSPPADDSPVNWTSWIQQWIDHTASTDQVPHFEHPTLQRLSTKRPFEMGNTPPPSTPRSQPDAATPRKRRRGFQPDEPVTRSDDDVFDVDDPEKTPSASSAPSLIPPSSFKLPIVPYPLHHPSRSNSQSSRSVASSLTGSTKPKFTRRSASPVKPGTLKDLQKPVEYVECTDNSGAQLSAPVRQLYRDIYDLAVEREGFIPASLKVPLSEHLPHTRPRYFSQDEHWEPDGGRRELQALLEIRDDALLCRSSNASEAAWNSDVHSPLLKLALKPFKKPLIRRHILTSTPINSEFVPPMREGSFYDKVGSKMVDYGIALHPDEDSPLDQAIRRALQQLPTTTHYFNHVAYDPIKYAANVVSIETKTGSKGPQEARSQLGIWIASWSFRMHQLLDGRQMPTGAGETGQPQPLIPVPVIVVIEHVWRLSFACDRGHCIDIVGDVAIGDTKSLDGLLMLVAVIRRLACWIQSDFQPWLQEALLSS